MFPYFDIDHFAFYILDIPVILRDNHATNVITRSHATAKKDIQVDLAGKKPNITIHYCAVVKYLLRPPCKFH